MKTKQLLKRLGILLPVLFMFTQSLLKPKKLRVKWQFSCPGFYFCGFATYEIPVNGNDVVNVQLAESATQLTDIVV